MPAPVDDRAVEAILSGYFGAPARLSRVAELAGDASTRRYYRISMAPGSPLASMVMMLYPEDVPPGGELPFVNVHRYLRRAGVPVPEIYVAKPESRLLFLEDAGDTMLEDRAKAARDEEDYIPLYERCVEILVRMQWDGTRALDGNAIPSRLEFDVEKFAWEIDFFFEHAVREYGGIALSDKEERAIEDLFLPFLEELAAPRASLHTATTTAATSWSFRRPRGAGRTCGSSTSRTPGWAPPSTISARCSGTRTSRFRKGR
jgi:aminoglycoside/choline kinase family phosphotransferase